MKLIAENNSNLIKVARLGHSSSALFALMFSSLLILTCFAHLAHADASKIVKWKDANGVTHYGDKMPAQESGRSNSVLNNHGTVIRTNEPFAPHINSEETDKQSMEKHRQDKALLASYSSIEEIDMAEKRNLKSDESALLALNDSQEETKKSLAKIYANFSGKKMSNQASTEVQTYQSELKQTNSQIEVVKNSIALTKARFSKFRTRYTELQPQ